MPEGWRPDQEFHTGPTLLAASGAAFTATVPGQAANAFALLVLLYVPPVAQVLAQACAKSPYQGLPALTPPAKLGHSEPMASKLVRVAAGVAPRATRVVVWDVE